VSPSTRPNAKTHKPSPERFEEMKDLNSDAPGVTAEEDEYMLSLNHLHEHEEQEIDLSQMDIEDCRAEVARLRAALHKEHAARLELEETCDMLALANQDLHEVVARLTGKLRIYTALAEPLPQAPPPSAAAAISNGPLPPTPPHVPAAASLPAWEQAPTTHLSRRVDQAGGASNPLSVTFVYPFDEIPSTAPAPVSMTAVAVGAADKCVRLYSGHGVLLGQWQLDAPVLWISAHAHVMCAGCMDGSSVLIDCSVQAGCAQADTSASCAASAGAAATATATATSISASASLRHLHKHGKYVVCTAFSPDGQFLATLSYDRSIHLYSRGAGAAVSTIGTWGHLTTYSLRTTPESMVFLPCPLPGPVAAAAQQASDIGATEVAVAVAVAVAGTAPCGWRLVVAARDELHLLSLSCWLPYQLTNFVSLNEQVWDTHAGMQALLLSVSPDLRTLAVSTDKSLVFLLDVSYCAAVADSSLALAAEDLRTRRSRRLKVLAGHSCGEYGKPALAWGADGAHLYSNSEGETGAVVWHTGIAASSLGGSLSHSGAKGSPAAHLVGHKGIVRALATHRAEDMTATVSYDHTLVLWTCKK